MAQPLIVLAHGAGAPSSSPWMLGWAERLGRLGRVVGFDYPYMRDGRKRPDRLEKLIDAHRDALRASRRGKEPVVLAGKSMGSRVGCHLSLTEPVNALVCLGYPLRATNGALRDEVLLRLRVPTLFVQGSRDSLCPLDVLESVRARMQATSALHVVQTGDHSLRVTKRSGLDQQAVDAEVLEAIGAFLAEHLRR